MLKRFDISAERGFYGIFTEITDRDDGDYVIADDALMAIAELEAYIEDRERTVNDLSGELATYIRIAIEYSATLTAQHETVERQQARIVELESQLAAALATIEAATHPPEWCEDCGMPVEHCRENHATGHDYAEGCKP